MSDDTPIPLRDAVEAVLANARPRDDIWGIEGEVDPALIDALRAAHEAHHYYVPPLHGYTRLVAERDELRAEAERLRSHSEKMLSAVLDCDPTPACMREDDQLEPPWETIRRMKEERDEARDRAFAFEQSMELLRQERDELRAEVERLRKDVMQAEADLDVTEKSNEELGSATKRLHKERDEARAEVERLRDSSVKIDVMLSGAGIRADSTLKGVAALREERDELRRQVAQCGKHHGEESLATARREGAREALERVRCYLGETVKFNREVRRDMVASTGRYQTDAVINSLQNTEDWILNLLADYAEPGEEPERVTEKIVSVGVLPICDACGEQFERVATVERARAIVRQHMAGCAEVANLVMHSVGAKTDEPEREDARAEVEDLKVRVRAAEGLAQTHERRSEEARAEVERLRRERDEDRREGAREVLKRVRELRDYFTHCEQAAARDAEVSEGCYKETPRYGGRDFYRYIIEKVDAYFPPNEEWPVEPEREDAEGDDVLRALLAFPPRATKPGDTPYLDALDAAARVLIRRALGGAK